MEQVFHLRTGGKINLSLRITGIRADGYHELSTLFLPLPEPCDEVRLRLRQEPGMRVECSTPGIDLVHNTLTRAYDLYAQATGFAPGLAVELRKGIPHGAGLGGGSADAALVLNWLQEHAPNPLGRDELIRLAAKVGADVPFFLHPKPSRAEGIGDRLTPVELSLHGVLAVLLCPDTKIDTAWAYAQWDRSAGPKALTEGNKEDKNHRSSFYWPLCVENCFEPVVFTAHPDLARLKARLVQEGACAAGLSGSGSALFGLFRHQGTAQSAARRLRKEGDTTECAVYGPFFLEHFAAENSRMLWRRKPPPAP